MIRFDRAECQDLNVSSRREWLETNGLGGFASSTVTGLNTRRYHALLVAAMKPPVERFVLLSKLEETLIVDGQRYELAANQYPGVIHPTGYQFLSDFCLDPFPVFTYEGAGVTLRKSVLMIYGENSTLVTYELLAAGRDPLAGIPPARREPRLPPPDARRGRAARAN